MSHRATESLEGFSLFCSPLGGGKNSKKFIRFSQKVIKLVVCNDAGLNKQF